MDELVEHLNRAHRVNTAQLDEIISRRDAIGWLLILHQQVHEVSDDEQLLEEAYTEIEY